MRSLFILVLIFTPSLCLADSLDDMRDAAAAVCKETKRAIQRELQNFGSHVAKVTKEYGLDSEEVSASKKIYNGAINYSEIQDVLCKTLISERIDH